MLSRSIVPAPKSALSLHQALELTNLYLENAYKATDQDIVLVLCHDTENALSQVKNANKRVSSHIEDAEYQTLRKGVATAYIDLGKLLEGQGYQDVAQTFCKKAVKWGASVHDPGRLAQSVQHENTVQLRGSTPSTGNAQAVKPNQPGWGRDVVTIAADIFPKNVRPPTIELKLPESDERLHSTSQLAGCLSLLQASPSPDELLEPTVREWLRITTKDIDEKERLKRMATEVLRAFERDELKDAKAIAEVVFLSPVLDKHTFHDLLREFYSGIDHSGLLNIHYLEGLAQLIQGAHPGHLDADDLVKILKLLSTRLQDTHHQSSQHMYQLTLAISHVLDAMADTKVTNLDRETLHEPLSSYLEELKKSPDPYLVYQAAYAYQALLCVPDNETLWKAALRRTGKVIQGVSGVVSAVKGIDLNKFIDGLGDIQDGFAGAWKVVDGITTAYSNAMSLSQSGKGFLDCLQEGLSFGRKRNWYSALRGADTLIQEGNLALFRKLVCNAPCRLDPAFQWGFCQRLGEIAANPLWDTDTRRGAIAFLGELYKNDVVWGQQASVKQWILNLLMQLSALSVAEFAETLLQELQANGDTRKQLLYGECLRNGPISYPLKAILPELEAPSLLDRVQNKSDVEETLRQLRKQRSKERGDAVYITPQAKANLQAANDSRFPLMEKVKEFLDSDQKVFLLLGDSGAGKSTFSRELEIDLWRSYSTKTGSIPLHINLPAIDKPEHDVIAKQLRKYEFSEPQIREMKHYRKFVLICDGYDESQQTQNLYMSNRLNQPGEWDAQMVISCRTEYLGSDFKDRFRPTDRNQLSDSSLFQEAVITPFSPDQIQAYIREYVSLRQPSWRLEDYRQALELIPSLRDLMTNPFLMTLSLDVLPRMVDPTQSLSVTHVTRVELYDHFVEQWLERGKKRLSEKDLTPQSRAILDRLSDEGFTQNGIDFMKRLAVAIYKEQGGHPVVQYSQFKDEGSWKDPFFFRKDKQLLREACPLTRNGNQHRFIHRSLLEYSLALAVFDLQDIREQLPSEQIVDRRGSVSSILSFEIHGSTEESTNLADQEPDINSPLVWRNFVNDHSLLQFLEERVQQEPLFKEQLLAYIEHSKKDKKWRTAAANAITILVRAGVQFIGTDLQGVQIPGADLSYGVFNSVNLQNADLRKANLRGAWLRQTNMSRAQMAGVQFGELPSLTEADTLSSCAYSPDGQSLAVGLCHGDINVYTTSNWEKIRTLEGHTDLVWRVVYSPNGDQIASCSQDKSVRLWDSKTGSLHRLLSGHDNWVCCVAYSPQGNLIASASDDMTVRIWDTVTGDCRQMLGGHFGRVCCVAYSPNRNQIASGGSEHTISLWDLETGNRIHMLLGHNGPVWDIKYSPRGGQLASASDDGTVRIWDVEMRTCRRVLSEYASPIYSIAYSPTGDYLASGSMDAAIRLWDVETGRCCQTLSGHRSSVLSVVYSPNGHQIASGSGEITVRLWDVSAGASRLASGGHTMEINSVKCSPNGKLLATGSSDSAIRFWDVETGACHRTFLGHDDSVFSIAYSPQGGHIASGSGDTTVRIWEMETGECMVTLKGHHKSVHCVAFSPQGNTVASASMDTTVILWNVATRECLRKLNGHTHGVRSVTFSPCGDQLASGGMDCTARIWDAETGSCLWVLQGHTNWVRNVVYSPQGTQLATAGYDMTIRLWDVETGECSSTLSGHTDRVISVVYSHQGNLLISSSWDETVRLWDVGSGECRTEMRNLPLIWSIVWGPPSGTTYFVCACQDGSVLKWEVIREEETYRAHPLWISANGTLVLMGASMRDVRGLSSLNEQLLRQRGAISESAS